MKVVALVPKRLIDDNKYKTMNITLPNHSELLISLNKIHWYSRYTYFLISNLYLEVSVSKNIP